MIWVECFIRFRFGIFFVEVSTESYDETNGMENLILLDACILLVSIELLEIQGNVVLVLKIIERHG